MGPRRRVNADTTGREISVKAWPNCDIVDFDGMRSSVQPNGHRPRLQGVADA